jgi:hypothetical protein
MRTAREEFEELLAGRTWRIKVLEAGVGPWPWTSESARRLVEALPGVPVVARPDLTHEAMEAIKARGGPDPASIIGHVTMAEFLDPHIGAEVAISSGKVHEALLVHHALSATPLAVSVVADVETEPAVLSRTNHWGHRVSEGMAECVARVGTIYSLDLVSRARAGGRLLMPVTAPVVEVREARVVESCAAVFALWPVTGRVSEADGRTWKVRIVKFGRSLNGWVWTKEAGASLVRHLTYAPVGLYAYSGGMAHADDEAQRVAQGPVTRNIAGHLDTPTVEADGVYGVLHLHEDVRWLREKLSGLARMGAALGRVLGLSVDVKASYRPEASGARTITSVNHVTSVDIVSSPSADGRFVAEVA